MAEFNFIVDNGHELPEDDKLFFGDEPVTHVPTADLCTILVLCGIFPSKTQVRKNWNNMKSRFEDIESPVALKGWTDAWNVGKLRHRVTILNPI